MLDEEPGHIYMTRFGRAMQRGRPVICSGLPYWRHGR